MAHALQGLLGDAHTFKDQYEKRISIGNDKHATLVGALVWVWMGVSVCYVRGLGWVGLGWGGEQAHTTLVGALV